MRTWAFSTDSLLLKPLRCSASCSSTCSFCGTRGVGDTGPPPWDHRNGDKEGVQRANRGDTPWIWHPETLREPGAEAHPLLLLPVPPLRLLLQPPAVTEGDKRTAVLSAAATWGWGQHSRSCPRELGKALPAGSDARSLPSPGEGRHRTHGRRVLPAPPAVSREREPGTCPSHQGLTSGPRFRWSGLCISAPAPPPPAAPAPAARAPAAAAPPPPASSPPAAGSPRLSAGTRARVSSTAPSPGAWLGRAESNPAARHSPRLWPRSYPCSPS